MPFLRSYAVQPNQGIEQSLQTALRITSIIMLFFVPTFAVAFPAVTLKVSSGLAIGYGVSFAWVLFLAYGGYVYIQHHVIRSVLSHAGHLPYNLIRFLDYAASLVLLRKVGGGYIFIHRYLLEYFADLGSGIKLTDRA